MQIADVIVGWPPAELLSRKVKVRLVQLPSAGYEDYLDSRASEIVICNAAGVSSPAVAEHCLALMLALARRLPEHLADTRVRRWRRLEPYRELTGSTVCIVGLGDIGREVARRCKLFGMTVIAVTGSRRAVTGCVDRTHTLDELNVALSKADFVIVALPGGHATRGLVDANAIGSIKTGAYLVNIGRGTTLDQQALIESLRSERLSGAGIDVWDPEPPEESSPLWELHNVIVTSHSAGLSSKIQGRFATLVVDNLTRLERGSPLRNQVIPRSEKRDGE